MMLVGASAVRDDIDSSRTTQHDVGVPLNTKYFAFRRTMAIGAVWAAGMVGLVATSPAASGQESVEPGRGSAVAQGYKIDPRSGRLSFGLTYGLALAGHQNLVAVGEARSLDLGVIGTTLAAEGCDGGDPTFAKEDQPQPLVVRSSEDGAAEGRTETENGVEKRARAESTPLANSVAITAAAGEAAAVLIGSTRSETTSGIVDGKRVARAVTDVSEIRIGGDALVIKGLRWEASWQSAPEEAVSGSFTVQGIEAAGEAIPVNDAVDALAQLNPVLAPLGIEIDPPQVRNESGISFVDPLRIGIVPSDARDGVVGGVVGALQPAREALVQALLEQDCGNASFITIADIVLGSVTGAGSLNIELGGVTAQSADLGATSLLGELQPFTPATPAAPATTGGTSSSFGSTGSTGSTGANSPTSTDGGTSVVTEPAANSPEESAAPLERIAGTRGGPLVPVGLAGLLLLGALAELDRRKMRKAQRTVPMEALN